MNAFSGASLASRKRYLNVPLLGDENVFGLEVAIDDLLAVQVVPREDDLRGVVARRVVCKARRLAQVEEHLTARHVFHAEVEVLGILEAAQQVDDERAVDLFQDALLVFRVLDLLHLDDLFLQQHLDRKVFLPKRARAPSEPKLTKKNMRAYVGRLVQDEHDAPV